MSSSRSSRSSRRGAVDGSGALHGGCARRWGRSRGAARRGAVSSARVHLRLSHTQHSGLSALHMSHYQGEISFKLRPGAATRAFIDLYNAAKTVKRVTTVKSHNAQRGQRTSHAAWGDNKTNLNSDIFPCSSRHAPPRAARKAVSSQYKASVKAFEAKGTSFQGRNADTYLWRGDTATEERPATYANT